MKDTVVYRETRFHLAAFKGAGDLRIDLKKLGIPRVGLCTGCWRGYLARFAVHKGRLVLARLGVGVSRDPDEAVSNFTETGLRHQVPVNTSFAPDDTVQEKLPLFHGRRARYCPKARGWVYDQLNKSWAVTGGMIIGSGGKGSSGGLVHPALEYDRVYELVLERGRVIGTFDRSFAVADIHARACEWLVEPETEQVYQRYREWVNSHFTQDYMPRGL